MLFSTWAAVLLLNLTFTIKPISTIRLVAIYIEGGGRKKKGGKEPLMTVWPCSVLTNKTPTLDTLLQHVSWPLPFHYVCACPKNPRTMTDLSSAWGPFNKLEPIVLPPPQDSHILLFFTEDILASCSSKVPWTPPYSHILQWSGIYLHVRIELLGHKNTSATSKSSV